MKVNDLTTWQHIPFYFFFNFLIVTIFVRTMFEERLKKKTAQYYFQIPGLMHQVINIALYFFLGLGVFAGQDIMHYYRDESMPLIGKLVFNFPLYYCAKYVLLIGWIKIAKDLQNPFGDDR